MRFSNIVLVTFFIIFNACKSANRSHIKDVLVTGQSENDLVTVLYYIEGESVYRSACPNDILEQIAGDYAQIRQKCSTTDSSAVKSTFKERVKRGYLEVYKDTALNSQEEAVLNDLMNQLETIPSKNKPPLIVSHLEEHSIHQIQTDFINQFDRALSVWESPVRIQKSITNAQNLADVSINANKPPGHLTNLKIPIGVLANNQSVNMLTIEALEQGTTQPCRAVLRVVSATIMTDEGLRLMRITSHPSYDPSKNFLIISDQPINQINHVTISYSMLENDSNEHFESAEVSTMSPALTETTTSSTETSSNPTTECTIKLSGSYVDYRKSSSPARELTLSERDKKMARMMASKDHRPWHFLWHGIRGSWPRMSAEERTRIRTVLGDKWTRSESETTRSPQSDIGEEFLHMHRKMLEMLQAQLGPDMYEAWVTPPPPNSSEFPLPANRVLSPFADRSYTQLLGWDSLAKDHSMLKGISLGDFGSWLEANPHNDMHMRWADPNTAFNPDFDFFTQPEDEYSHPSNNYLGSTFSSHVHPYFWRLHGWVDARINDWLKANGYSQIKESCTTQDTGCYQWKRTWTGSMPETLNIIEARMGLTGEQKPKLSRSLKRLIFQNSHMNPGKPLPFPAKAR